MNKKTFLIVDDEPIICNLLAKIFDRLGHDYYLTNDNQSAIKTLKEHLHQIDVAIVDLIMPETNGLETIRNLKKIKPDLIALLSSGQGEKHLESEGREYGVDGFLSKPYSVDHLTMILGDILGEK